MFQFLELQTLISGFCESPDTYGRGLGEGLQESLESLEKGELPCSPTSLPVQRDVLDRYYRGLERQRDTIWVDICEKLTGPDSSFDYITTSVIWPQLSIVSVLSLLNSDRWQQVPETWRKILTAFAHSVTYLRRSERLLN